MQNGKRFLKEAGVLLIVLVMIFSSGAAIANTNKIPENPKTTPVNSAVIWDNGIIYHGGDGGIFVATERSDGYAEPADDFQLDKEQQVDSIFWQGGYFQCELAQGFMDYDWSWRVIFWDDYVDGSHPGTEIYNRTITNTSITRELWYAWTNTTSLRQYWVANYSAQLPEPITFQANKKYWITLRGIGEYPPQACWVRHNGSFGGIKIHQAVFRGVLWSYPNWINLSEIISTEKIPHDFNFQLLGPLQNNPPGAPTIEGKSTKLKPKTVYDYTFNAVDPDSDDLYYYVDWGDGNNSGWVGKSASGVDLILNHSWAVGGKYTIKAKVKDIWSAESDWAELEVTVPRPRTINNLLHQLLERFPNAFPILRQILRL
jgi:hypothetical protein